MDAEGLKDDVRAGRIDTDRLVELIGRLQRERDEDRVRIERLQGDLEQARHRIEELEKRLGSSPAQKLAQSFSVESEERRQEARGKKARKRTNAARRGRVSTADKIKRAERTERVFPAGVAPEDCRLSHIRPLWRLEKAQSVLVAYEVYRCGNRYGQIPGAMGRSEFGLEIVIAIAYQVYILGLSFDKVCAVMGFFQNLKLKKSQADALLNQLARRWEGEFDLLCTLLAHSAVVHADETSWSLNSVWAFLSEHVRVLFFGVHKDAATLKAILDPERFAGLVISDDAAVYANFTLSQKCWAHLLRKAIKLTLLAPDDAEYRAFTDGLLEIYREACRVQRDRRLGDAGRTEKVAALDDAIFALCAPRWADGSPTPGEVENDYRKLVNEVMRLMLSRQVFTFVTAPAVATVHGKRSVSGTNNEAERTLRNPAEARKTGRTSKTLRGARRQSILHSVLESLRAQLANYTLASVVEEVLRWSQAAQSCFAKLARKLGLKPPDGSILDRVLPVPSG
jgi:transposase